MEATNKKKMGRPIIGLPKTITIRTRIDDNLNEKIEDYCNENKITKSDFLREIITEKFKDK